MKTRFYAFAIAGAMALAAITGCKKGGGGGDNPDPNPPDPPAGDLVYNKTFGGSGDDYVNPDPHYSLFNTRDIKLDSDGTVWMCGSTASTDGDFAANHGGIDAWLLHIDPATDHVLYSRCFGGSSFDEFCSMVLVDGTVWVAGTTGSSDGDLTGVTIKGNYDGWVMHIDPSQATPAAQITYNRCIGGPADDLFYKIAIAPDKSAIWLCGETFSAAGDNTGSGFHTGSGSDAWLVSIDPTKSATFALKYNRCFGGTSGDGFDALQPMNDGTIWVCGITRSIDGDIAAALTVNHGTVGTQDGWLVHINPSFTPGSQLIYNRCFGGTNNEIFDSMSVLTDGTIWLKGSAGSANGDLLSAGKHGGVDVWLLHINPSAAFSPADQQIVYNRCFGGSADDGTNYSNFTVASDGTIWVTAETKSTDGDLATAGNKGGLDTWAFNLNPSTNQFNYNKCWGGTGDEVCPAIAPDAARNCMWVSCGTTSNATGDVPATKGKRDAWIFNVRK